MARSDEDPIRQAREPASEPGSGAWLAGYSARFAKTAEDTMRVGTAAADRWARRSLEDGEWSVDSVTADVIADWEEMTPLMGRWLDLWLEAVQQGIRGVERAGTGGQAAGRAGQPDLAAMVTRRLQEYGELWEGAAAKLRSSSYRSEDLLDDWFRFWGRAVRDMTAGPALLWGGGTGTAPPPDPAAPEDDDRRRGTGR
jgi:hypothetical protein